MSYRLSGPFLALSAALLVVAPLATRADEGMWTFDNFPASAVNKKFGVDITPAWLDHVRKSTVRLSGCTASFVSPEGLTLTNHHCVDSCLAQLSKPGQDRQKDGFVAGSRAEELRCPTQNADVLVGIENITAKVNAATAGLDDKTAGDVRRKTLTQIEQACEQAAGTKDPRRCETVKLYKGGQYFLYQYKRYDDVRIVFAPETDIGAFGGDPDNFQFPRWSLDMSLLRVYENGKPASTPNFLAIDWTGPDANEPVFVPGHPGLDALLDPALMAQKARDEADLRAKAGLAGPQDPWEQTARATQVSQEISLPYGYLEGPQAMAVGFNSALFRYARTLVRGAAERPKPSDERLREFRDTALPLVERRLLADVPVYPDVEEISLSLGLMRMRELLGPDHPVVTQLMRTSSPEALARDLVTRTRLGDAAYRRQLWEGGAAAVAASDDPMIRLAAAVDAEARAIRKRYEDEVEAPTDAAA